MRFKKIST